MNKILYYALMTTTLLCSCGGKKNVGNKTDEVKTEVTAHDTVIADIVEKSDIAEANDATEVSDTTKKSLNDIRFAGWTEKEWLDNEYIRTLRRYLDDYSKGWIENEELGPYRKLTKGQFVVGQIEPFMLGGVFMYIMFVDEPEKVFTVCVYSEVNAATEEVGNYSVRDITYQSEVPGIPKELLQQMIQEHPEMKVW